MSKKILVIILAVVVVAIGLRVWLAQEQSEKYTGPLEKATLGVESSLLPAAVWIAENKGFFQVLLLRFFRYAVFSIKKAVYYKLNFEILPLSSTVAILTQINIFG